MKSPVSRELGEIIDKLLKKEIEERYQLADEIISATRNSNPDKLNLRNHLYLPEYP